MTFVVHSFPSTSQTFIDRQITGLLDLGHEVRILAERRPQDPVLHPAVREYGLQEKVTYVHEEELGRRALGAVIGRLMLRKPSALGLLRRDRAARSGGRRVVCDRVKTLLDASPTDVLHYHFGYVGLRYAEVGRELGIPQIVSFYGWDCSGLPRQRGEDLYEPLFRGVDRVTVLSDNMKARLMELGCPPELLRIHHLGVDPSEYAHRERVHPAPGEPVRLLTVARLVEKKGVEYCLQAVAQVLASRGEAARGLRYDVIGDGPLRGDLEARASELGLDDSVRFHGSQDQEAVRRAMMSAHLFLLPSVTAEDGDQEGTPTVLVEASSTGLPVLSTWHSGIPEIVLDGQTGFLVPERDADALAERLGHLLDHPELWQTMGRDGRRHIEESFATPSLSRELVQHYRDIMESGG
ncbi:MAG: glycosyltransferase [Gemmatimonadetes bacterium]|nr:glycosyltransferase [Gemmatimonadota bacterium]NNF13895.1 glycosyltransferase [Gemmatimonadota bacterium]NNL31119.1 glycosyltransferase [Gemmatimonadota bacterium]